MKQNPKKNQPRGFALVVTLSMMILLTVIAVGLLTLSSVSIRAAGQNNAMSIARANAKLALMIAIGDLQKSAGPDKSITAPSDIIAENPQKPNLTGVWDSWDMDVKSTSFDYDAPKTRKSAPNAPGFKGWLVSDGNIDDTAEEDYPTTGLSANSVELVGEGSLGENAADSEKVRAGKVPVMKDGKRTGYYAWHVSDESVKARINTYRDASGTQTLSDRRSLLAGHRPDLTVMQNSQSKALDFMPDDSKDYSKAVASVSKIINLNQVELYADSPTIKTFRNDVTPYSLGLLTNVREGGLKQDLTSLFELTTNGTSGTTGLPTGYASRKLYQTSIFSSGSPVTGSSDPYWSALAGYYNTYKELITPEASPKLQKAIPKDIQILTATTQPTEYAPAPVISKVELLFSMIARDKHAQWKTSVPQDYMLHMLYIPLITIHNPYNVSLQFDKMKVGLEGVPVGFKFYVNGVAKSDTKQLSSLFTSEQSKKFWLELANWPSATATNPSAAIVMKPGQSMVFGPYINSAEAFGDNDASYFDYGGQKTGAEGSPLKAKFGFAGASVGFDVDWLCGGVLGVNKADSIYVEFKSMSTSNPSTNPFRVTATLTNKNSTRAYGGMNFLYSGQPVMDKILPGTFRYPKTGGVIAQTIYAANTQTPGSITTGRAFGLFSAYSRTANGGVDSTGQRVTATGASNMADGRLAGNPFLHNNAARSVISTDLSREKPGMQSHELNLVSLNAGVDDAFSIAADYRTNTLLNYKQVTGRSIKSGSYLEIPSGPLQAISDFRRSNALASPFLPAFVQPVGNSYASPLMSTDTVSQSPQAGFPSYVLLDHSFLANHMLYDRNYFSTFAPMGTTSASDGFTKFALENKPLRTQLFQSYLPSGKTVDDAKNELFSGSKPTATAFKIAAQYQMVKGAFNVNSTRVEAWKAMLSSMKGTELLTMWAKTANLAQPEGIEDTPIPSMTLYNGGNTRKPANFADIDDAICNEWNGYRGYTDKEIDTLARRIVDQVRLRGPFQSMSEFVNRRLGSDSDLTRMGALQNAIDEAKLNDQTYANGSVTVRVNDSDVSNANLYGFRTPKAATGNPAAGAPGWLSQGDILKILEPAATVRSDTFVIRACGEATDATGNVIARTFAEAVVQRIPEYVNPADPPTAKVPNPNNPTNANDESNPDLASAENIAFGRRFVVVSFRWLAANEI